MAFQRARPLRHPRPRRPARHLLSRLGDDLRAGRCSVADAAARLAATAHARDPAWLATLRGQYPGRSDAERLAAFLRKSLDAPTPDRAFSFWAAASPPKTPRP